jgi:DNA-binding transcriptional ArsR family regulator
VLESLFGSVNRERVLAYLVARQQGYARGMAAFFGTNLRALQVQLDNLEAGGVLVSRREGRTRLYGLNPRWPLRDQLVALVERMLEFYPAEDRERLLEGRRRPRRRGKPQ